MARKAKNKEKPGRGRPKVGEALTMAFPSDLMREAMAWGVRQKPPLTHTDAIRALVRLGLDYAKRAPKADSAE